MILIECKLLRTLAKHGIFMLGTLQNMGVKSLRLEVIPVLVFADPLFRQTSDSVIFTFLLCLRQALNSPDASSSILEQGT